MYITLQHQQNTVPLSYLDYNEVDPPSRSVVLIHGLGDCKETWSGTMSSLKDKYRLIALDLRGHGDSLGSINGKVDFSFGQILADIKQIIDKLQINRFVFIAHSIGVRIAIAYAAEFPSQVSGMVLEDLHLTPRPKPDLAYWDELDLKHFKQHHSRYEDAKHMAILFNIDPDLIIKQTFNKDDILECETFYSILINPYYNFLMLQELSENEITKEAFKTLNLDNMPILLLRAKKKSLVSQNGLNEMLQLQPKMQHQIVEGSTHCIHYKKPEKFTSLCEHFLDGLKP